MKRYEEKIWCEKMRLRVDYNNMMSEFVGEHGINVSELNGNGGLYSDAAERMKKNRGAMRWRELPYIQQEVTARVKVCAEKIRANFKNFVVLGIGGSALGPIAVQQALSHLRYNDLPSEKRNGPKLYVEDNVDPERMASLFDVINVEETMFNVITKSGSTSETMSQLLLITDVLKKKLGDNWRNHIVATTDERKGNLIKIAKSFDFPTFFVPDGVGGRFSELCPVGLLAASVCGIDIDELLAGAKYMDERCAEKNIRNNPAYMLAALETCAMKKGCNISVLMPYADSLKYMADWYAQLWAESLGKTYDREGNMVHAGQTPVKALGVTDQHSQVQLYTQGPFDKVITFLGVDKFRNDVEIPHGYIDIPDVAFLGGHSFSELMKSEQYATEYAITKSGHMNKTITLPEVNAFTLGQLICLFELQTAFAGELLNINAFDQPGVEEGKNATYALLGKQGFDEKKKELDSKPQKLEKYIVR